jgi:hypothetical protein
MAQRSLPFLTSLNQKKVLNNIIRFYSELTVDNALEKARAVPRQKALKKKQNRESQKIPIFAVKYDPRLPAIQSIQDKHWTAMTGQDQYLSSVFPESPLTAFKRQDNLRGIMIR